MAMLKPWTIRSWSLLLVFVLGIAGCSELQSDSATSYPCGPDNHSGAWIPKPGLTYLAWTSEGTRIVFDFYELGKTSPIDLKRSTLWVVDADNLHLYMLVNANPGHEAYWLRYGFHADLSPDSTQIAYTSCEFSTEGAQGYLGSHPARVGFNYEIATINLDGRGQKRLTENLFLDHYPMWSPDGSRIAFIADPNSSRVFYDHPGQMALYTMSPDGTDVQRANPILEQGGLAYAPPMWSPNGMYLAFLAFESEDETVHYNLYTVHADMSEMVRIANVATVARNPIHFPTGIPSWSPDGEFLAFVTVDRAAEPEAVSYVYVSRPDGSESRNLLEVPGYVHQVLWSPSGEHLAFVMGDGKGGSGGVSSVYTARADGTEFHHVLMEPQGVAWSIPSVSWSPQGSELLIVDRFTYKAFLVKPNGNDLRTLELNIEPYSQTWLNATWSPGGERIAIYVLVDPYADMQFNLFTLALDGKDRRDLVTLDANGNLVVAKLPQDES